MTDQYAVIGNPVAHSKSPGIHAAFARQTGQDISYTKLLAPVGGFRDAVRKFQRQGGKGLNVTVPFKREAWELADERSARAELAGAVNTLSFDPDGRILGENTDGIGLVHDILRNQGGAIAGRDVLVLGAGGAVRGVLGPLLEQEPARLVVANRTAERAVILAAELSTLAPVSGCGLDALAGQQFALIINGTAASLASEVPAIPDDVLAPGGWCYDMMYSAEPTAFVRWGEQHGAARSLDGLGMLVEQAAESFRIWRGVLPDTGPILASLRAGLAGSTS